MGELMSETHALPHFRRAPITEFAISIQFQPLTAFTFADIGPFREFFRRQFPKVEFRMPMPPQVEIFAPGAQLRGPVFQLPTPGAIPLTWLLAEDGGQVLQFQPDRLVRNWRRTGDERYPRYPAMRDEFFEEVELFRAFLRERGLGELSPVQCELTYVNNIPVSEGVTAFTSRAFANWRDIRPAGLTVEDVSINQRFIFEDENQRPIGRIYFQSGPGIYMAESEVAQLLMFGRAVLSRAELDEARRLLDRMHDLIVHSFVELTTSEIRAEWEQVT
jgi:uncharacterized protein (TIGR04255 family)